MFCFNYSYENIILLERPTEPTGLPGAWMTNISGKKTIGSISIPGTHNSGADCDSSVGFGYVQCQDLSIYEQLVAGIRYLDIRCRHINNTFVIHNGAHYLGKSFDDVLSVVTVFLKENPGETVLMRVKQEHTSEKNTRSFEETFDEYFPRYPFWIYDGTHNPTLDNVRGKIVVIKNFNSQTCGPFLLDFKIQDNYNPDTIKDKLESIREHVNLAKSGVQMVINHLSAYRILMNKPRSMAHFTNNFMTWLLKFSPMEPLNYVGIIPADFPHYELILAIIRINDEYQNYQNNIYPNMDWQTELDY